MNKQSSAKQEAVNPEQAYKILKNGNERYLKKLSSDRDLSARILQTSRDQNPFAAVLSCIDSRVPVEFIFDQSIGDVFSIRVAGNVVNPDVLASLEFACQVKDAKIIVVMGHTRCGAIAAACEGGAEGNMAELLGKIDYAVKAIKEVQPDAGDEECFRDEVSVRNVFHSIDEIRNGSRVLRTLEKSGKMQILAALYEVHSGRVRFLEDRT